MQQAPGTAWKQNTFDAWLGDANHLNTRRWYQAMSSGGGLAGPLDCDMITELAVTLIGRVVILEYQRTYDTEMCLLAVFDSDGWLFKAFRFECEIDSTRDDSMKPDPMAANASFLKRGIYWKARKFSLRMSDRWNTSLAGRTNFLRYSINHQDGSPDNNGFFFCSPDFDLINDWCSELEPDMDISPTACICVLWHALSADMNVIREYLWAFYDGGFEDDLRDWPSYLKPHGLDPKNKDAYERLKEVEEKIDFLSNASWGYGDDDHDDDDDVQSAEEDDDESAEEEATNLSMEMLEA